MRTWYVAAALILGSISPAYADSPEGIWRGRWRSQSTGHQGTMRVRVWPRADGAYEARYSGTFALVIPFTYRTTLRRDTHGNLVANKPLGPVFGSYNMTTDVWGNQMAGSFQAAKDRGTIQMHRLR